MNQADLQLDAHTQLITLNPIHIASFFTTWIRSLVPSVVCVCLFIIHINDFNVSYAGPVGLDSLYRRFEEIDPSPCPPLMLPRAYMFSRCCTPAFSVPTHFLGRPRRRPLGNKKMYVGAFTDNEKGRAPIIELSKTGHMFSPQCNLVYHERSQN